MAFSCFYAADTPFPYKNITRDLSNLQSSEATKRFLELKEKTRLVG